MTETIDNPKSIIQHFDELRRCLLISIVAIIFCTAIAFFFSDYLLKLLLLPSGGLHLRAFNLMDGFFIKWRVALFTGFVASLPVLIWQLYRFVRPAFNPPEQKVLTPFVLSSFLLFYLGVGFGYYLLWGAIRMMLWFFSKQLELLPSADNYLSFVVFFMCSCGVVFFFPLILLVLAQLGIITATMLRKQRKIAYFVLFVIAELITPVADPIVAPLIMMTPLVILFEITVLIARRIEKKRALAAKLSPS